MASLRQCLCCGDVNRRLSPLNGFKLSSDNATVTTIVSFLDLSVNLTYTDLFLCDPCVKKVVSFVSFQTSARNHAASLLNQQCNKRLLSPPVVKTPKRSRLGEETSSEKVKKGASSNGHLSVVEQIISSVEKLKLKNQNEENQRKAKKSLFQFEDAECTRKFSPMTFDHAAYSMKSQNELKENDHLENIESLLEKPPCKEFVACIQNVQNFIRKMKAPGASVLGKTSPQDLTNTNTFAEAVQEINLNCEFLFDLLNAALGDRISTTSKISTIATIYGMILHSNNNKISAVQRLFTSAAVRYHADNKLLAVLNKIHITLSDNSKPQLMDSFASHSEHSILQTISSGIDGKLNGDNLDLRVETNDVRMDNRNKDYHFFASDWVADRVSDKLKDMDDSLPLGDIDQVSWHNFVPTSDETNKFKEYMKILLARKIVDNMQEFKWMQKIIPCHIAHDLHKEMSTKSEIFLLPILLKNEACYSDCLHILDQYVEDINRIYAKAGRGGDLDKLRVPVGGDQLTRVRLEGAKALRKGAHTNLERFDQLHPFIVELFHTLQDFLEKLCKKFLKLQKATDKATLAHLKMVIQRSNVNGKVKVRFKAHEQFIDIVGTSYLLSLVMELFGMQNLNDVPVHDCIPANVSMIHMERRTDTFNKVMDLILARIFIPPLKQDTEEKEQLSSLMVQLCTGEAEYQFEAPVTDNKITLCVSMEERNFHLEASVEQVKNGCTFTLPETQVPVTVKEVQKPTDELHNYAVNFLNWYFAACSLQDAISEGNIYQTNITLKLMVPLFYSHSSLSKYMTECIDFILKTEILLTPKMALKVRAASFVNPTGRPGHNKAADMEKENEVKLLKDLIRGLGANKTENAIVRISKVAPVINSISDNLNVMTSTKELRTTHKTRSSADDIQQILDVLMDNNPWQYMPGRKLKAFKDISKSPYDFNQQNFEICVMDTVDRLKRCVPVMVERESDDDYE